MLAYKGLPSLIVIAILLGILIRNTAGVPQLFNPCVAFAVDKLLKLGIILIGVRRSFSNLLIIDGWSIPIIVSAALLGLISVTYLTRILKLPDRLGTRVDICTSM